MTTVELFRSLEMALRAGHHLKFRTVDWLR